MSKVETEFKVNDVDYQVKMPTSKEQKPALMEYNRAFGDAIKSGAVLRAKLNTYMQEQNIWTQERQDRLVKLAKDIGDAEKKLKVGGIKLKEAIDLAKQTRINRDELQILLSERSAADSNTAEGQAENAKFQKLLTLCLVYKNDTVVINGKTEAKPVFNTIEDLIDIDPDDKDKLNIANQGFDILGKLMYKLDDQFEAKLPENAFLKEWGVIDEKLRFINKKGELVDELGRRVDDKGRLINDKGELIDGNKNKITEEGELIVEDAKPFLDENDNPIVPPTVS